MRPLTSDEIIKYGSQHIYGGTADHPHFLAESRHQACARIAEILATQFGDYYQANSAMDDLAVVAAHDARKSVRLTAINTLNTAVLSHASKIRIRNALFCFKEVMTAASAREGGDPEVFRVASLARTRMENIRRALPVRYRPSEAKDAAEMAALFTREYWSEGRKVDAEHVEICSRAAEEGSGFVAELNGQIVGMAAVTIDADIQSSKLEMLAVIQQHSGCGIGRKLLEHSMGAARRLGATEMSLGAVDYRAREFYLAADFVAAPDPKSYKMTRPLTEISPTFGLTL